jgi:hypothetical protein
VAELSDRFSLILHDLRMGGAWKRTNRGRLKRTEEMLCAHIPPEPRQGVTLLDIGASDGITTVEAVRALRQAFGSEVYAFLADRDLWLLRYRRGPIFEYRAGMTNRFWCGSGVLACGLPSIAAGSSATRWRGIIGN